MTSPVQTPRRPAGGPARRPFAIVAAMAAALAVAAPRTAEADPYRFAQFDPLVGLDNGQPVYNASYLDDGLGGKVLITTATNGQVKVVVPIAFEFTDFAAILPAPLLGRQDATLEIDIPVLPGVTTSGAGSRTRFSQALGYGTITIRRTTAYLGQDLLLQATIGTQATNADGGELSGRRNATVGETDVAVNAGDAITFTSAFLNFSQTNTQGVTLSLNPLFPSLQQDGQFLRNFRALISGQFSVDGPITFQVVPEPGSIALLGLAGLVAAPVVVARLRRRAA